MNSIGRFAILAAGILTAAVSCVKESALDGNGTSRRKACLIKASNPAGTKTVLDGLDVLWEEGDMVGVVAISADYDKVRVDYDYDVKAENIDGASADFTAFLMGDHKPAIMVYPGNESIVYDHEAQTVSTTTSNQLTAVPNTFPSGSNLSIGKIVDDHAQLKNLMSVFKFEVTGSDVVEVKIEARGGESIAGDVVIDLETMEISSISGWSSIRLVPEEGKTCLDPGVYCVPVPAGHYSQGLAFDFLDTDGFHARKNKTEDFDLPSGKLIELGRQSDWGIDIHVGFCSTGELEYLGANRFRLSGNQVKGKDFEYENTVFGVEYSLDKGKTWEWIEYGTLSGETVDMEFEVVTPGKMLYRTFAKYRGYDPVRGEEKAYVPENLVFTIVWSDPDEIQEKLEYVGNDQTVTGSWPKVDRPTNKQIFGETPGDNCWDMYKLKLMPDYWVDWGIKYPGNYGDGANSDRWYSITTSSLYLSCQNMYTVIPAVLGCKLDRVMIVSSKENRRAYISSTHNELTSIGQNKSYIGTALITQGDVDSHPSLSDYFGTETSYYYAEWTELSTNPGEGTAATGRVTLENTPYYIHNYTNYHLNYMELEYIPVE